MATVNPYDSPGFVPAPGKKGTLKLDYGAMFRFGMSNPNWMMNLAWGSLCVLAAIFIPILPQLILQGYMWEILEALHRRQTSSYADFDINKFGQYLTRSIWPFLVSLVVTLGLMVIIFPLFLIMLLVCMAAFNQDEVLGVIAVIASVAVYFAVAIGLSIFTLPVMLRAALCQDFGKSFDFGWIKQFVGLMWKDMIIGGFVFTLGVIPIMLMGYIACFIGVLPAAVYISYIYTHFLWQLYEIFLDRGGTPIPLKPPPAVPAPMY